jgi:hypothetical protein
VLTLARIRPTVLLPALEELALIIIPANTLQSAGM